MSEGFGCCNCGQHIEDGWFCGYCCCVHCPFCLGLNEDCEHFVAKWSEDSAISDVWSDFHEPSMWEFMENSFEFPEIWITEAFGDLPSVLKEYYADVYDQQGEPSFLEQLLPLLSVQVTHVYWVCDGGASSSSGCYCYSPDAATAHDEIRACIDRLDRCFENLAQRAGYVDSATD
jgi:hypothetical protein